jgi:hypothetical protein
MYKTRVVAKAWNDHLLKTTVPEGVIYTFSDGTAAATFPARPSFLERELLRRELSTDGHKVRA